MKTTQFFPFVFFLSLAPLLSGAQFSGSYVPSIPKEADYSYLHYWASPLTNSVPDDGDFTPVIIANRPVVVRMLTYPKNEDSKVYRISETGAYEYSFAGDDAIPKQKQGFKPVTVRTFFLEASSRGVIPPEITYQNFIRMPLDDRRALVASGETAPPREEGYEYMEANLVYQTSRDGLKMIVTNDMVNMELTCGMSPGIKEGKIVAIKYLPYNFQAPQLVKLLIDPWNNYQLAGHAYYKNVNSVFDDLSLKLAQ